MSKDPHDPLVQIFFKHLHSESEANQSEDDLIYSVVVEYMLVLMESGNVPHKMMDTLESDLKEEVRDMYKKATYGFVTLKDYRETRQKLSKKKRAS